MNRREFVATIGASVAAPLARAPWPPARLNRIGLELYSVRDAMKADPDGTLAKVKAMGYNDVELLWSFNNFGRTPKEVRAALDKEGLHAPSGHIAPEALLTNWQKSIDDALTVGNEYLIVPSLPAETNRSIDAWARWAAHFNNAGHQARKAGLWLAFHNEPTHVRALGGQIPYDLFLQRTDPLVVRHQLDTGNMVIGGGDPMRYLTRYRDRYHSFHIKDVAPSKKTDTELGKGTFDIRKFLAAIPDVQSKPCYVEQEGQERPLESAAENYTYLRNLEF